MAIRPMRFRKNDADKVRVRKQYTHRRGSRKSTKKTAGDTTAQERPASNRSQLKPALYSVQSATKLSVGEEKKKSKKSLRRLVQAYREAKKKDPSGTPPG